MKEVASLTESSELKTEIEEPLEMMSDDFQRVVKFMRILGWIKTNSEVRWFIKYDVVIRYVQQNMNNKYMCDFQRPGYLVSRQKQFGFFLINKKHFE